MGNDDVLQEIEELEEDVVEEIQIEDVEAEEEDTGPDLNWSEVPIGPLPTRIIERFQSQHYQNFSVKVESHSMSETS